MEGSEEVGLICNLQRCEGERWRRGNGEKEREEIGDELCWCHRAEFPQGL